MTAYGPPRQIISQDTDWLKKKAERQKLLARIRAQRAEMYRRHREKLRRQAGL